MGVTFRVISIEENQAVIVQDEGNKPKGDPITVKKG